MDQMLTGRESLVLFGRLMGLRRKTARQRADEVGRGNAEGVRLLFDVIRGPGGGQLLAGGGSDPPR